jgi:hypothetical protein
MRGMAELQKRGLSTAIGIGQIATMIVGFGAILIAVGAKSEQINVARTDIDKLAATVNDLARAQASAAVTDATHAKTLEDIQRRLQSLESRIR